MGKRGPCLVAAATIVLLALTGCMDRGPAPVYTVNVSTAYEPEMTPEEDRDRARQLGFEEGDPATRGEPEAKVYIERRSRGVFGSSGGTTIRCWVRDPGSIFDTEKSIRRYCIGLNETGGTWFRVQDHQPLTLDRFLVVGPAGSDDCRYLGDTKNPALRPGRRIDRNLTFEIPYGIECD